MISGAPLKIAVALESSGPGGAERMLLGLSEALRDRGHEVVVISERPGWMTERAEAAGLPVWLVPQKPGVDLRWVWEMSRRLRREGVDFLHAHEFGMSVFGGAAARLAGVPSLATIHGKHWVTAKRRRAQALRWLHRMGQPIVAVSEDLADFLAEGLAIPRAELRVVLNGIPVPAAERRDREARRAARSELGIPTGGALLVAVGNLYRVKDHATLLRALARLQTPPDREPTRVAIAGRGEEEDRLRSLARELGIEERVHLLGLRDDVDRVLAAGDVFVQPSRSEGLPMALLEAMAAGLPAVVSRVGGMVEAVAELETGHLVPPGDPDALARALAPLLESPAMAEAMGRAARERVVALYSVEQMAERYEALYAAG